MFYKKLKDTAVEKYNKAIERHNKLCEVLNKEINELYDKRKQSIYLIKEIEDLINSIANSPKEFEVKLSNIKDYIENFVKKEEFAKEAQCTALKSGGGALAGTMLGTAIVSMGPTAAMAVATTFGTASTGVAISSLSGAAATNAALAWLGGGALAAGGGGMAAGHTFLAMAGPVGWGIAIASLGASVGTVAYKNNKVAKEATDATEKIERYTEEIRERFIKIRNILDETRSLKLKVKNLYTHCEKFYGMDYETLPEKEQIQLGTLVNNTYSLAELLNKEIE